MIARREITKDAATAAVPVRRRATSDEDTEQASYFVNGPMNEDIEFFTSGCAVVDMALGGGWALGRVSNVVGDRSAGKTLMAMEAAANFAREYPTGWIRYAEAEEAFEKAYAKALGIPISRITFNPDGEPMRTVELWYEDLKTMLEKNKGRPGLYILDTLDAVSDSAEMDEEFDKGTYGGAKPKAISKLFRMLIDLLRSQRVHLMVISQIRDKFNVRFGDTKTRSGGRALDFYASQIAWLVEVEKIKKTIGGISRIIGVGVEMNVKKNKVGLPLRRARYSILYGYGIDDLVASVEWLIESKREHLLAPLGLSKSGHKVFLDNLRNRGGAEVVEMRLALAKLVQQERTAIETTFLSKSRKY